MKARVEKVDVSGWNKSLEIIIIIIYNHLDPCCYPDHNASILGLWWVHIFWLWILVLNHHLFEKCVDLGEFRVIFSQCRLEIISILFVGIYQSFYGEQLAIQLSFRIYVFHFLLWSLSGELYIQFGRLGNRFYEIHLY